MSLFLVGNFDVERVQEYFERKELKDSDVHEEAREKLLLQDVKQTDSMRMEVSSPKLAIGVRGKREIAEADCYRYHIFIKIIVCNDVWLDLRIVFRNYMNQVK